MYDKSFTLYAIVYYKNHLGRDKSYWGYSYKLQEVLNEAKHICHKLGFRWDRLNRCSQQTLEGSGTPLVQIVEMPVIYPFCFLIGEDMEDARIHD